MLEELEEIVKASTVLIVALNLLAPAILLIVALHALLTYHSIPITEKLSLPKEINNRLGIWYSMWVAMNFILTIIFTITFLMLKLC